MIDEIAKKNPEVLRKMLQEQRDALRTAQFAVGQKQLKNVRAVRGARKEIARLLTALGAYEESKKTK